MQRLVLIIASLILAGCAHPWSSQSATAARPLLCYPQAPYPIAGAPHLCYPVDGNLDWGGPTNTAMAALLIDDEEIAPLLPWPPPAPTWVVDLTSAVKVTGQFAQIARRLEAHLTPKDYEKLFYYRVPDGFAVVTELERFRLDGTPQSVGRFKQGKLGGFADWNSYFRRLLFGEEGRYRIFIFVVTNRAVVVDNTAATAADVERWTGSATFSLPPNLAKQVAPTGTKVMLLVYEFAAEKGREGRLVAATERAPRAIHARWLGLDI